jgi:hypothetical protein
MGLGERLKLDGHAPVEAIARRHTVITLFGHTYELRATATAAAPTGDRGEGSMRRPLDIL